jgi:hypothetical protein
VIITDKLKSYTKKGIIPVLNIVNTKVRTTVPMFHAHMARARFRGKERSGQAEVHVRSPRLDDPGRLGTIVDLVLGFQ